MTSSCTETVNGTPQEETVAKLDEPVKKTEETTSSTEEEMTTTLEASQEQRDDAGIDNIAEEEEDDDSDHLDLDFGFVMGASIGLPQEEEEEEDDDIIVLQEETVQVAIEGSAITTAPQTPESQSSSSVPGLTAESSQEESFDETPSKDNNSSTEEEDIAQTSEEGEDEPTTTEESASTTNTTTSTSNTIVDTVRKGAVAVAGGTLTAVGLVMIPLPTPMGCVVAGSGMALLGTEFEAANRVMAQALTKAEEARDTLIGSVEAAIEDDGFGKQSGTGEITITKEQKAAGVGGAVKSQGEEESGQETHETDNKPPAQEEVSSEFVISVNADAYFDQEELQIEHERQQGGFVNNYVYNPVESFRKRLGVQKRGFLATSVLPMLQKTKQFASGGNGASGSESDNAKEQAK